MKQDLNHSDETIENLIDILCGSSRSDKQISILVYLLNNIQVESFSDHKMDEILNLFLVIYLKSS